MSGAKRTDPATRPILRLADSLSRRRRSKRQRRALPDGVSLGDDHAVKKRPPRVHGPYGEPDGYRVIVVTESGRKSLKFPTEDAAQAAKARLLGQIRDTQARTIGDALDEYRDALVHERGNLPQTAADTHRRLVLLLPTDAAIKTLTAELAADCYRRAGERASRTGRTQSAATLAFVLKAARRFGTFCVERSYLSQNPFAKLRGPSKIASGKAQLTADEARRFLDSALALASQGQRGAVAAALQLALGLRSSEVLARRVRDLDEGASVLLISDGKTRNARRRPTIPDFLRPHLRAFADGRPADAYLFGTRDSGKPRLTGYLVREVARVCRHAAVPVVCPHSLRGLHATLALRQGVASQAVAAALGHASFSVTARHYADPTQLHNTQVEAVLSALAAANSGSLETVDPANTVARLAETLRSQLAPPLLDALITQLRGPAKP